VKALRWVHLRIRPGITGYAGIEEQGKEAIFEFAMFRYGLGVNC
jgi:hypothetical protein